MSKFDSALTTFAILIYMGALTPSQLQEGAATGADPSAKLGVFFAAITAPLVFLLVVRRWALWVDTLRRVTWPIIFATLAVLSTIWSINPGITLRRSIVFVITTSFAIYLASLGAAIRDRFFGRAAVIAILLSFIVIAFFPTYGISSGSHLGEWRGIFDHKNIMGRQMVFTFYLALCSQAFESRTRARVVAGVALFLLIMSHSGTGISAFAIVLVFAGLLALHSYFARREGTSVFWFVIMPAVMMAGIVGLVVKNEIFLLLGKDESLTGRTTIWAVVFKGIAKRPNFGWGYDAFFTQRELASQFAAGGIPNHAHDGFFNVILALGFFGLGIFLIGYLIAFRNAWRLYRSTAATYARWPLIFLVMLVFVNLTESNLIRKGSFMWVPYVAMALWGWKGSHPEPQVDLTLAEHDLAAESVPA